MGNSTPYSKLSGLLVLSVSLVLNSPAFATTTSGTAPSTSGVVGGPTSVNNVDHSALNGATQSAEQAKASIRGNAQDPNREQFAAAIDTCQSGVAASDTQCQASSNPSAQQATTMAQPPAAPAPAAPTATSPTGTTAAPTAGQSCDQFAGLMGALAPLLGAFQNSCNDARSANKKKCDDAVSSASQSCASLQEPAKGACENNAKTAKSYAGTASSAQSSLGSQASAIASALANALLQQSQMQGCQQDMSMAEDLAQDTSCSLPENANTPTCICQVNPRASSECPGFDTAGAQEYQKNDSPGATDAPLNSNLPSNAQDPYQSKNSGKSSAANNGGGAGFGGGGGGGRGPEGGKPGDPKAKAASGDILAGDYGGGGMRVGAGAGLPEYGGAGLARALANKKRATASIGGASGAYGRSNWQKVRESYRGNRGTLLPSR